MKKLFAMVALTGSLVVFVPMTEVGAKTNPTCDSTTGEFTHPSQGLANACVKLVGRTP